MNYDQLREFTTCALPLLFSCEQEGDRLRIETPYLYPNGDYIDIYLVDSENGLYVTDLGETTGYLADYGVNLKQSPKRGKMIADVILTHGAELTQGELRVRVHEADRLAWAIVRLGQAAVQISDLVYTLRIGALTTFKEEVQEFLTESRKEYDLDYVVIGASGESYTVDFYLPTRGRSWLVDTLSSESRSYANSLVSRLIRTWHDVRRADGRYGYMSIVDDTSDVWRQEWLEQLSQFSEVIPWSGRERILSLLGGEQSE